MPSRPSSPVSHIATPARTAAAHATAAALAALVLWTPAPALAQQLTAFPRPFSVTYTTYKDGTGWGADASDGAPSGGRDETHGVESLRAAVNTTPLAGGIRYSACLHDGGWQPWATENALAVTPQRGNNVEALRMELTGMAAADYDVWYRVFVPGRGWMGWAMDGQRAGTVGTGQEVELIQARVLPKDAPAPGPTTQSFVDQHLYQALAEAPGAAEVTGFGGYEPSQEVRDAIDAAIRSVHSKGDAVSCFLMDLTTYRGIEFDADRVNYAASSIKAPYMAGVIYLHPEAIHTYEQQIRDTLVYSWDHTYKELVTAYGEEPLLTWMSESGASYPFRWFTTTNPWSAYTARDMARMWVRTYQLFDQTPEGEIFGQWAENPETSAIHGVLGDKYRTRSKAGWVVSDMRSWCATVDAGIVYADNGPYVVAIMTDAKADFSVLTDLTAALDAAHQEM